MILIRTVQKKLVVFWRIPFHFKIMFFVNFFLCGIARFIICISPLPRFSPYFGRYYEQLRFSTLLSERQRNLALQIGRSVRLAAKYTPWDSSCLTQAMVATFWCRQFYIPYVFYIGLRHAPEGESNNFLAHAWVMAGPLALTGGNCFATYNVISTHSTMGGRYQPSPVSSVLRITPMNA
jgi:hypothetical protein